MVFCIIKHKYFLKSNFQKKRPGCFVNEKEDDKKKSIFNPWFSLEDNKGCKVPVFRRRSS